MVRMTARTFAIGDIHGDLVALDLILSRLPAFTAEDTIVFLGDYVDRGPDSKQVIQRIRDLAKNGPAKVVALRGNHEDAWLKVIDEGWPEFLTPRGNGCIECMRSFVDAPTPKFGESIAEAEYRMLKRGEFFPADVVAWMRELRFYYEDEHAIYVHAGIRRTDGAFPHPSQVHPQQALLWLRDRDFFVNYRGKLVVFGHTSTGTLPQELSAYTPDDPKDMWAGPGCVGLDTGAGKGGFLTALELPARVVYESR